MQEHGTRAKSARKWRPTTTQSGHGLGASPDLLGRDFGASGPNQKWLCDITYIPTDEGFLYLAGVMDAWSRSIVGWSMSESLHARVALDALRMAVARRRPPRGLVHHSDRGVQYACGECRAMLASLGQGGFGTMGPNLLGLSNAAAQDQLLVVPIGAPAVLAGLGLVGIGFMRRRMK
jgi:transposase InsO family protein